jgi:hypothetical protein
MKSFYRDLGPLIVVVTLLCAIASQASAQSVKVSPSADSLCLWGTCTPPGFICRLVEDHAGIHKVVIRPFQAELVRGVPPYHVIARYDSAYFEIVDTLQLNSYQVWYENHSPYHPAGFRVPFDSTVLSLPGPCELSLHIIRNGTIADSAAFLFTAFQTGLAVNDGRLPRSACLLQVFPNPFNPSTRIRFALPAAGPVTLRIFNIIGEEIATLVNGPLPAGEHGVSWDGRGTPCGIYICQLKTVSGVALQKVNLIR